MPVPVCTPEGRPVGVPWFAGRGHGRGSMPKVQRPADNRGALSGAVSAAGMGPVGCGAPMVSFPVTGLRSVGRGTPVAKPATECGT